MNAIEALADPTRRRIVELLADGERSAGDIAAQFETSRPGVSRHLRVLREHRLVQARGDGQRRLYSLDPAGIEGLRAYFDLFWTQALAAFKEAVEKEDG